MSKKNLHVVRDGDDWKVKREGADRASSTHETQAAAERAAIRTAKNEHGEVFIHGRDGHFSERKSYGNDPYPPEG